ncbi:MAG TPA: RodZ domain-containing protein [Thermoleophilia bacterium]|nr:RodZ domain-containing protein [Thermoleophilia bacterium]
MFEIGNTLREARVRRNLTLQQVEEDTKIRVKYVQAMENEDFDIMPGATYVKGFLRTYSTYLGLDPDVILGEYRSRGGPANAKDEPFGGSSVIGKPHSHRGRNTLVFVAVLCLLVLGVIWVLGRGSEQKAPQTSPSALGIGGSPTPKASLTATPSQTATAQLKDVLKVNAAYGDCWTQVRKDSATGSVLFTGTLAKGHSKKFKNKVLWVRLGSPSMVKLVVEGKTQPPLSGIAPADYIVKNGKAKKAS